MNVVFLLSVASSVLLLNPSKGFRLGGTGLRYPTTTKSSRHHSLHRVSAAPPSAVEVPPATSSLNNEDEVSNADTVICGGGPAGLLSAIMLAQKFPNQRIRVYDRLGEPPSPTDDAVWSDVAKFYLIGLGSRGQCALSEFGVWPEVEAVSTAVVGRKDWAPDSDEGVERIFTDRPVTTQVLPRDKLVGVLSQHIQKNYAEQIELNFGYEVQPIEFAAGGNGDSVLVQVAKCDESTRVNPASVAKTSGSEPDQLCSTEDVQLVSTNLLIAADGTARTIANEIERADKQRRSEIKNPLARLLEGIRPFRVKRYLDDNQRIYKTIPIQMPPGWRYDINYSARTKGGRVVFDGLPADREGSFCGVLLLRKEDSLAQPDSDPKELRSLLDETLPQFSTLLDDETVEVVAKKPPSYLPAFRYVGPRLHQGNRTLILGDCAHTVKPYFGLGANSALEDVRSLADAIDANKDDLTGAVHQFSKERAGEAKALVRVSRELDRPGALGFVTFILPLILDSIFHGMLPKLFDTNMIAMLQREGITFQQAARRKRYDRIGQATLLSSVVTGMVMATKLLVRLLAKVTGRRSSTVVGGLLGVAAASNLLKRLAPFLIPGLAPADVLAKTKSKVVSNDTFLTREKDESNTTQDPEPSTV